MTRPPAALSATLAERLGYGPDDRLLIVNCDDLGSSRSANIATFRAMTEGIATSASLMVPCPWARDAAERFQGMAVGIHLTLTSEYPDYRWRGLTQGASLHDSSGVLPTSTAAVVDRIQCADARAECRSQIEAALAWGLDITHLDTHMDALQSRSDLFEIFLDLAEEFRLPIRAYPDDMTTRYGFSARARASAQGVLFPDTILYPWPRPTRDVLFETIPRLPPGVHEIFIHPVLDGEELRAYDRANAHIRTHDAECAIDPAVRELLERHAIRPISYKALRDLQRSGRPG